MSQSLFWYYIFDITFNSSLYEFNAGGMNNFTGTNFTIKHRTWANIYKDLTQTDFEIIVIVTEYLNRMVTILFPVTCIIKTILFNQILRDMPYSICTINYKSISRFKIYRWNSESSGVENDFVNTISGLNVHFALQIFALFY